MKEELKPIVEAIANNPKTSSLITVALTWINANWLEYGKPVVEAATNIVGLAVLIALLIKHILDIKKEYKKGDE
jgi:large-conductance mechanosensitive channel